MAAHLLEGDGVSLAFYNFLAKENRHMESARVYIPSTIIFDNGFASSWFHSTPNMEVKKRNPRDISADEIYKELATTHSPDADIVAMFLSAPKPQHPFTSEDCGDPEATLTSYFTRDDLRAFLFSPGQKPRGVLQKFEYPKGWCSTVVQATWSPQVVVTEALRNPYSLFDKTKEPWQRASTFESELAKQIATTNSVTAAVCQSCHLIASHLEQTSHIRMSGMVLFFKVNHRNRVLLLYSSSLRVRAGNGIFEHDRAIPLCLVHQFVSERKFTNRKLLEAYVAETKRRKEESQRVLHERSPHRSSEHHSPSVSPPHKCSCLPPLCAAPVRSMTDSTLYKLTAKRIGYRPGGLNSRIVVPAFFGAVKRAGKRWVAVPNLPPIPNPNCQSVSLTAYDEHEREENAHAEVGKEESSPSPSHSVTRCQSTTSCPPTKTSLPPLMRSQPAPQLESDHPVSEDSLAMRDFYDELLAHIDNRRAVVRHDFSFTFAVHEPLRSILQDSLLYRVLCDFCPRAGKSEDCCAVWPPTNEPNSSDSGLVVELFIHAETFRKDVKCARSRIYAASSPLVRDTLPDATACHDSEPHVDERKSLAPIPQLGPEPTAPQPLRWNSES